MALTEKHEAIWDEKLGYHERKPRVVRCTCGWQSQRDFDVRIKPAFAQHKREAASRQGAPRQAEEETTVSAPVGAADVLRELGIAVHVGTLVPTGAAVRLDIDDTARWLEPNEARTLAVALEQAASDAVHEDRAARRG